VARMHQEQCVALVNLENQRALAVGYSTAPGVQCLTSYLARALWMLGYPEQARRRMHEGLALARELAHPFTLALALYQSTQLALYLGEMQGAAEQAEALMALAAEQGFAQWIDAATFLHGKVLTTQGQGAEALAQMRQGLTDVLTTGGAVYRTVFLTLLVEALGKLDRVDEGLRMLAEAVTAVDESGQRLYDAELQRLRGELLLRQAAPDAVQAEACFQAALDVARRQEAKPWELRAAMSLARLWQSQGKRQDAHDLLLPVYEWFTEGFDTADVQDAKGLLVALASLCAPLNL
jgi:predicted ATPase